MSNSHQGNLCLCSSTGIPLRLQLWFGPPCQHFPGSEQVCYGHSKAKVRRGASSSGCSTGLATNSIFFLFPFRENSLICLEGKINDPSAGKHTSLPFRLATPLSPSWTLEWPFELTRRPSRPFDSPYVLHPELERNKDTVRCAELGHTFRQQQLTQTLIVRL